MWFSSLSLAACPKLTSFTLHISLNTYFPGTSADSTILNKYHQIRLNFQVDPPPYLPPISLSLPTSLSSIPLPLISLPPYLPLLLLILLSGAAADASAERNLSTSASPTEHCHWYLTHSSHNPLILEKAQRKVCIMHVHKMICLMDIHVCWVS